MPNQRAEKSSFHGAVNQTCNMDGRMAGTPSIGVRSNSWLHRCHRLVKRAEEMDSVNVGLLQTLQKRFLDLSATVSSLAPL